MRNNVRIYRWLIVAIIFIGLVILHRHDRLTSNLKKPGPDYVIQMMGRHLQWLNLLPPPETNLSDYGPQVRLYQYPNLLPSPETNLPDYGWRMETLRKSLSRVSDNEADLIDLEIIKYQTEVLHTPLKQFFTPDEWLALYRPALERSIKESRARMAKHPQRWNEWDGRNRIKSSLRDLEITIESLGMTPQQLMDALRGKKE